MCIRDRPVVVYRIKNTKSGVSTVAGDEDHLYPVLGGLIFIKDKQFSHQRKSDAWIEYFIFSFSLILAIRFYTLLNENPVALFKIE